MGFLPSIFCINLVFYSLSYVPWLVTGAPSLIQQTPSTLQSRGGKDDFTSNVDLFNLRPTSENRPVSFNVHDPSASNQRRWIVPNPILQRMLQNNGNINGGQNNNRPSQNTTQNNNVNTNSNTQGTNQNTNGNTNNNQQGQNIASQNNNGKTNNNQQGQNLASQNNNGNIINNQQRQNTTPQNNNGNTNNNQQGQNLAQQNNNSNTNNNQQGQNNNSNLNNNQQGQNNSGNNNNNQQGQNNNGNMNNNQQGRNNNGNGQNNGGVNVINFSNPVQISGGNSRTVVQYADGFNVDTISANRHTLNVQLNQRPPSTDFVTPLDPSRSPIGGPWVSLTNYSYVMSFENANPDDLIMRLQVPYNQNQLNSRGVSDGNVYLALYEPMRSGWVIDMDRSENRRQARVTELNAVAAPRGEYILLARRTTQSNDESNPFLHFGSSSQNQFNVLPPPPEANMPPLQIGSWQDGSKVMIRSSSPMQIQMSLGNVSAQAIPPGFQSPSRYACVIRANTDQTTSVTHLQMPYVPTQLTLRSIDPTTLVIMGRPIGSQAPYQVLSSTSLTGSTVLMNTPMTMVAGEFVLGAPGQAMARTVGGQILPAPGAPNAQPRPLGPTEAMITPAGTAAFAPAAAGVMPPQPGAASVRQQAQAPLMQPAAATTSRTVDLTNSISQEPSQATNALLENIPGLNYLTPSTPQILSNAFPNQGPLFA